MEVIIKENYDALSIDAARVVAKTIREKPTCVLGLATGQTPIGLYRELIRMHRSEGLSFAKVTTFNLDEYVGLPASHNQSYAFYMQENLFRHIDINQSRVHIPQGIAKNIPEECALYEKAIIENGGIDLQILGLGVDGHIGFNEPSSSLNSATRIKTLTPKTIEANARFFKDATEVPRHVITMGVGTIFKSRYCVILASGAGKAHAVKETVEGPMTAMCPASALQMHQRCTIFVDKPASEMLSLKQYYEWTYDNKPDWQR